MNVADIFGVDLGTTNSAAGIVRNGRVELVADKQGKHTVASYVAYPPNGKPVFAVGNIARQKMKSNPVGVIYDCKRLIGMSYNDPIVGTMKKYVAFQIVDDGNNKPQVCVKQKDKEIRKYPEEIGASILQELHKLTSEFAGFDMRKVVITVPAYFNQYQRQATKDAGKIAGLDVVAVISEPVAAAYAYADQNDISADNQEKIIMIYDLGGGTFDVTIMSVTGTKYRELGLDGDLFLGGSDFDTLLMDAMIEEFEEQLDGELTANQRSKLRFKCEEAKIALKVLPETEIEFGDGDYVLSRSRMDNLLRPMIQRSIDICDRLIESLFMTADDIDDIILVGGSSRLNLVHSMLKEHYHKELRESINPDECVAYGATKYGYFLSRGGENELEGLNAPAISAPIADLPTAPITDVPPTPIMPPVPQSSNLPEPRRMRHIDVSIICPSDIGIGVGKGILKVVIPRRTILPYSAQFDLTNYRDNVTEVSISIFQGNHRHVRNCRRLQTLTITGVTPKPAGQNCFGVIFCMDKDGNLSLQVVDKDSGQLVQWNSSEAAFSEADVTRFTQDLADITNRQEEYQKMTKTIITLQDKGYAICSSLTDCNKRKELKTYVCQLGERDTITEEDIAEVERVYSRYQCCVCSHFPPRVGNCDNELSERWKRSSEAQTGEKIYCGVSIID